MKLRGYGFGVFVIESKSPILIGSGGKKKDEFGRLALSEVEMMKDERGAFVLSADVNGPLGGWDARGVLKKGKIEVEAKLCPEISKRSCAS